MAKIRLVRPSEKFKKSFIAGIKEFRREEGKSSKRDILSLNKNFPAFVSRMEDYEKGKNLPKKHVPTSYYWLIDGNEFIGEVSIRHKLNQKLLRQGGHIGYGIRPSKRKRGYGTKILALALHKAKQLGIKRALITCKEDNVGSWKIVEANRGMLKNKIKMKSGLFRRYYILIR